MPNKKLVSFTLYQENIQKLNSLSENTGLKKSTIIDRLIKQTNLKKLKNG